MQHAYVLMNFNFWSYQGGGHMIFLIIRGVFSYPLSSLVIILENNYFQYTLENIGLGLEFSILLASAVPPLSN